jgi:hypothetical protein
LSTLNRDLYALLPIVLMMVGMGFYWRHGYRPAIYSETENNRFKGRMAMDFATWVLLTGVLLLGFIGWHRYTGH